MNIHASNHITQPIRTHHIESSNLEAVGYDTKSDTLEVDFKGGRAYQYYDVPRSTYNGLTHSRSKGHYFAEHIRDQFEYTRIDNEA